MRTRAGVLLAFAAATGCVSRPPPTAAAVRLARNPPATVEGRVLDTSGRPVAGIRVQAIPRAADVPWSAAAPTDGQGRFRLWVAAPAEYAFLLSFEGISVVTPDPADPSRVKVAVAPGDLRGGTELTFLRERWREIAPETFKE